MSHERLRALVIVAVLAGSAAVAPFLPGALPSAFGIPAGLDTWVGRVFTAWCLPGVAAALCLIFRRLSASDPARDNYRRFESTYQLMLDAAVVFVLGLHGTLLTTLLVGVRTGVGRVPPILLGVLLVAVGNALPRLRPNEVVGIPTSWARSSPEVWARSHRLAGYIVVSLGIVILAATFLVPSALGWLVGLGTGFTALALMAVSWFVSRKGARPCAVSGPSGASSPGHSS